MRAQIIAGLAGLWLLAAAAPAAAADRGTVASLQGELRVNGRPVARGAAVGEGDTLESAPGALADVVMESGVRFRLYGKSKLVIPADSRKNPLQLAWGRLLSIVTPGRAYAVAGRTGVAGVRGTTFYVESQPGKRTYVCICKGKLHLEGEGRDQGDVAAEHHAAFAVDGSSKTEEPMIGHTDEDIAALAAE